MNRLSLALAFVCLSLPAAQAQTSSALTLYVHDTTGTLPDTPLPSLYQIASTPVGGNTPVVLKMINTSGNTVFFSTAFVSTAATSTATNSNFSVTGLFLNQLLVAGASVLFTVNFAPTSTGVITGYLNLAYQVQQNGCVLSGTGTVCPSVVQNVSTMNGTASSPVLTLSYQSSTGPVVLTPSSASPLNFPSTSLSSPSSITFTLTNSSTVSVAVPTLSLPLQNSTQPGAFAFDPANNVPATIAAGQSANFVVDFQPGQVGLAYGVLQIGTNSYPIQGYGIVVATIDTLQISYTNSTGTRTLPQAATPIPFGQVVPGSGASVILTFNVLNPPTSANPVTIPAITLTPLIANDKSFILGTLPDLNIKPGNSINFTVAFTPVAVNTFKTTLSIGSRSFQLTGDGISSSIPSFSITTSGAVVSQQQLNLVIQLSAPSPVAALGTLTMKFAPSVTNVTDDAAVLFPATGGRQLNISLASGAQTATYSGQSSIAFQTGTTAGILTFSVAFPNTTTYTQSFTISSVAPVFTDVEANRESPNLLVTVKGFDNAYSAGVVSFTFYDTSGQVIGNPLPVDETSAFHQLFYVGNSYGGVFSLQASFLVTAGDITKVGSVAVSLANTAGTTSKTVSFQ